jgi:SOS-response transcriptional repressor LexA
VPILGTANCGPATFYTETNYDGYLKVSSKLLDRKKDVYALRADGISMNKANVKGKNIEEGDYLIVNSADTTPADNDIVVSVFDDVANIKKFKWDQENNQVVLLSESTRDFPPIFIHEDDNYHIVGKVIQVIKKPSFK